MIKSLDIDKLTNMGEVVLCDSKLGEFAHKELYNFKDEVYIHLPLDDADSFMKLPCSVEKGSPDVFCNALKEILIILNSALFSHPSTIHLVLEWQHLMQVSLWNFNDISKTDIINLLSNAGLSLNEIENIKHLSVHDIVAYLLHRARFDIFRRVCHFAKRQITCRLTGNSIQIICHLASPETKRIVASSL